MRRSQRKRGKPAGLPVEGPKAKARKDLHLPLEESKRPADSGSELFSGAMKKAIRKLQLADREKNEIAEMISLVAKLTVDRIPVSCSVFAELMAEKGLKAHEAESLYRARTAIESGIESKRGESELRKGFKPQAFVPSLSQLCGIFIALERDSELFESFVDYCGDHLISSKGWRGNYFMSRGLKEVFKDWVKENKCELPVRFPDQ